MPVPSAATSPADTLATEAWRQCYLDPVRSAQLGQELIRIGQPALGWFHVGLSEARLGHDQAALAAQAQARETYAVERDALGLALCDEVLAMCHRHRGDLDACWELQQDLDHRTGLQYAPLQAFIAHNSRAITAKLKGDVDGALQRFYAALDAARLSGLAGPEVTALGNLGGYHLGLFNNQDARMLCEKALQRATTIGADRSKLNALANLMIAAHIESRHGDAIDLAGQLEDCARELSPAAAQPFEASLAMACLGVGDIDGAMAHLEHSARSIPADRVVRHAWLSARCLLARSDASGAMQIAVNTLAGPLLGMPYDVVALHRVAADASEMLGDLRGALDQTRHAQQLYEQMIGRSMRASHVAQRVQFELEVARGQRSAAELDLQRMAEVNEVLAEKIAETELLHTRLREQAMRDPLTGLHNRRYLFEVAPSLIDLSRRGGSNTTLAMLDLDRFKALNDGFGHDAGDRVLNQFGGLLTESLRRSDVICRHGGEEFVVLMPNITAAEARTILERLQRRLSAEPIQFGDHVLPACTFSAGVVSFPLEADSLERLLFLADHKLYRAKHAGRARIDAEPEDVLSARSVPAASAPSGSSQAAHEGSLG